MFFKISQKVTRNYAYIGKKTYAKNFKKSPNLVTLTSNFIFQKTLL